MDMNISASVIEYQHYIESSEDWNINFLVITIIETSELWRKDWQLVNAVGLKKNWAIASFNEKIKESDG